MNSNPSLIDIEGVELDEERAAALAAAEESCRGRPAWRSRKCTELHNLLAIEQLVPRVEIVGLDIRTEWKALVQLKGPVPCLTEGSDSLVLAGESLLALTWPEAAMAGALEGYRFVGILRPRGVWSPWVSRDQHQRLCLGAAIPPCTPILEILIATWGALTMQSVSIDPRASEGVMNGPASVWWSDNLARLPLSEEPFLALGGAA